MKKVKITVMKMAHYADLMAKYENEMAHACDVQVGQTFVSVNATRPDGFCDSAWETILPFVTELANGGGIFYDGWM